MAIRIPVMFVIEMDDEQQAAYARRFGLPAGARAKDYVESVRTRTLNEIRESSAFGVQGYDGTRGASVSVKGR